MRWDFLPPMAPSDMQQRAPEKMPREGMTTVPVVPKAGLGAGTPLMQMPPAVLREVISALLPSMALGAGALPPPTANAGAYRRGPGDYPTDEAAAFFQSVDRFKQVHKAPGGK